MLDRSRPAKLPLGTPRAMLPSPANHTSIVKVPRLTGSAGSARRLVNATPGYPGVFGWPCAASNGKVYTRAIALSRGMPDHAGGSVPRRPVPVIWEHLPGGGSCPSSSACRNA
jgi:hypothetical protein